MPLKPVIFGEITCRNVLYVVFFFLPVGAALFVIAVNQLLVPRVKISTLVSPYLVVETTNSVEKFDLLAPKSEEKILINAPARVSPQVVAQIYHYAIAASATLVLAAALVVQCILWQNELSKLAFGVNRWVHALAPLATLSIAIKAWCDPKIIDDQAVGGLLSLAALDTINPPFLFADDSRILGCVIFTTFLFAAATTALAAAGSPHAFQSKKEIDRRMDIVRFALLATSVVLVCSLVAAKLRLDTGAFMFGDPSKSAAIAFQTVANAVMNYWAAVLSIGLTFIYGPPALYLYRCLATATAEQGGGGGSFQLLTYENVMRVIRLLAILAPPIVAAGLEVLSK